MRSQRLYKLTQFVQSKLVAYINLKLWSPGCLSVQFSSVAQSCPTLCDPVNCSTPGLPVHYQLPGFTQTHVHYKHGNEYDHSLVLIYIFLMAINAENIFMFLLAICIILETCLFQSLIPFLIWLSFCLLSYQNSNASYTQVSFQIYGSQIYFPSVSYFSLASVL